jgi:cell division cycle 2-like protein
MDPSQQPDTVEEGEISLDVTEQPPDTSTVQSAECTTVASGKRYSRWDLDTEDTDEETQASKSKRQRRSKKQKATGADAAATSSPTTAQTEPDTANATPPVRPYRRPRPIPPLIRPCGSVDRYERLNRIDEGSYGVVYRGRDRVTGEIVALKRLKCEHQDRNGFPITDLREIHSLLWIKHENIVNVREIVVGGGHPPK